MVKRLLYLAETHCVSRLELVCADKLNSPVCRRTRLEKSLDGRHFLPCVASYPDFALLVVLEVLAPRVRDGAENDS